MAGIETRDVISDNKANSIKEEKDKGSQECFESDKIEQNKSTTMPHKETKKEEQHLTTLGDSLSVKDARNTDKLSETANEEQKIATSYSETPTSDNTDKIKFEYCEEKCQKSSKTTNNKKNVKKSESSKGKTGSHKFHRNKPVTLEKKPIEPRFGLTQEMIEEEEKLRVEQEKQLNEIKEKVGKNYIYFIYDIYKMIDSYWKCVLYFFIKKSVVENIKKILLKFTGIGWVN